MLSRNKNNEQLTKWKKVLIVSFVTIVIVAASLIAYAKWCEHETKPLLDRLEQIANHEIEVDQSAGKEYRFSLNLRAKSDEVFSKSSIETRYVFLIGNSGKIRIKVTDEYKNIISNEYIQNPSYVDLYIELIDDQWVIKDMIVMS